MESQLTVKGFAYRLVAATALVLLTFNPSGWSYAHWLNANLRQISPPHALAGLALIVGWAFFVHSTLRSIGTPGLLVGAAFFAALVWLFVSWGWLSLADHNAITWVALAMISLLLAIGVSWSHLRRRVAGQTDVDDVDQS
jgi:Family of unknown function (DUF6524)